MNPSSFISIFFWGGGIALLISFLLLMISLVIHFNNHRRKIFQTNFSEKIRPYLMKSLFGESVTLPAFSKREKIVFLYLFNQFHETVKGEVKEKLNQLAFHHQFDEFAISLFRKNNFYNKILAIWTLGHLGDKRVWDEMLTLLDHKEAYLSLAAAQNVMRIEPKTAIFSLIPRLIKRKDWAINKVISILTEPNIHEIGLALVQSLPEIPPDRLPLFLYYLEKLRSSSPLIRQVLNADSPPDVIAAALPLLQSPVDLPVIRYSLKNRSKAVRIAAIQALALLGSQEDVYSGPQKLDNIDPFN